jgi:L-threonylcarbamoyladenylate synthase
MCPSMKILTVAADAPDEAVIAEAADVLRQGGVVAYPTDTLYGLAVDPRRDDAVSRLYALKGRDGWSAVTLIAASLEQAQLAAVVGPAELRLARTFWPGPLTIVMPPQPGLSPAVLGSGTTVGVRVPSHAVARALAAAFGFCITATSANRSGEPPAVTGAGVAATLAPAIDLLVDAGPVAGGTPSTIVEIDASGPRLIRRGAVAWDRVLRSVE